MFRLEGFRELKQYNSKYQAPVLEHPTAEFEIETDQIHANYVEAFNASLKQHSSAFRCKTNMYAKTQEHLQRTLNIQWIIHNFVHTHFTTQVVPAVKLGILEIGLSWSQLFTIRYALYLLWVNPSSLPTQRNQCRRP
jgi:hypothetical protein